MRFWHDFTVFCQKNHQKTRKHEKSSFARVQNWPCKKCAICLVLYFWPLKFDHFWSKSAYIAIPPKCHFWQKHVCQMSKTVFSKMVSSVWQMVPFMRGIICQKRVLWKTDNLSGLKYQPKLDMLPIVHTETRSCTIKCDKMPFMTRKTRFYPIFDIWETYVRYEKHERAQKTQKRHFSCFFVFFLFFGWPFFHDSFRPKRFFKFLKKMSKSVKNGQKHVKNGKKCVFWCFFECPMWGPGHVGIEKWWKSVFFRAFSSKNVFFANFQLALRGPFSKVKNAYETEGWFLPDPVFSSKMTIFVIFGLIFSSKTRFFVFLHVFLPMGLVNFI